MQRRVLSGNPRRNADRLLVKKRALALHEGTVKLLAGSRTRTTLLESPRVDPGLGNIVATLLARRTCLFSDVPITIEPVALGDQILKTGLHGLPRRVRTET